MNVRLDAISGQVPIRAFGTIELPGPSKSRVPYVQLDASHRPDMTDLARVCRLEGEDGDGQMVCRWWATVEGEQQLVVIDAAVGSPVRCQFAIVFELPKHRGLLDLARAMRTLAMLSRAVDDPAAIDSGFLVSIDPDLAAAAVLAAERAR